MRWLYRSFCFLGVFFCCMKVVGILFCVYCFFWYFICKGKKFWLEFNLWLVIMVINIFVLLILIIIVFVVNWVSLFVLKFIFVFLIFIFFWKICLLMGNFCYVRGILGVGMSMGLLIVVVCWVKMWWCIVVLLLCFEFGDNCEVFCVVYDEEIWCCFDVVVVVVFIVFKIVFGLCFWSMVMCVWKF